MDFPQRYFYAAFLVPYTASLDKSAGESSPKWRWIERWLSETTQVRMNDLRQWWTKEVMRRTNWPSRTLLYALSSGAAVYFERQGGKSPLWAVEWSASRPTHATQEIRHPLTVKRRIGKDDLLYLKSVLKYVPLAQRNIAKLYMEAASLSAGIHDRIGEILGKEMARRIDRMPGRTRMLMERISGSFDGKDAFEREKAKLIETMSPETRRYYRKLAARYSRKTASR